MSDNGSLVERLRALRERVRRDVDVGTPVDLAVIDAAIGALQPPAQGQAALVREKLEAIRDMARSRGGSETERLAREALDALGAVPAPRQDVEALRKALLACDSELFKTYGDTPRLAPLFAQIDAALARVPAAPTEEK